ncbi:MAG: alpha/beta hydrolase [Candidatus Promineifilaceae bacterium]|nr:alpha/beta hydrolase [Candidatus Promineifilaceae bacterium]
MSEKRLIDRGEAAEASRAAAPGQFVRLSDGLVHYELAGSGDAQTVILVSGFSVPYPIWDPTFSALVTAGFQVLRYDLYGRGYSDRPDTIYDQDLFDRQLANLIDALRIKTPVDLVGLSLGGAIAIVFTDRHPEWVRRLGLIDPAGLPWKASLPARISKAPLLGELIMALLGNRVLLSNLSDYLYGEARYDELKRQFIQQLQFAGFKRALLSTLRNGAISGAEAAYRRVGVRGTPTILFWGREDRVVPFELSERVMQLIPNAEFHAIANAAHVPHFECPEVVNPLLIDFLTR